MEGRREREAARLREERRLAVEAEEREAARLSPSEATTVRRPGGGWRGAADQTLADYEDLVGGLLLTGKDPEFHAFFSRKQLKIQELHQS